MHGLGISLPKGLQLSVPLFLTLFLAACDEPIVYNELRYADITGEIWDGHNPNRIRIRCGKDCTTLAFAKKWIPWTPALSPIPNDFKVFAQQQKQGIHRFLRKQSRNTTVYIAPCDTGPIQSTENKKLARWVANEVTKAGYVAWITKPVIPLAQPHPLFCVNLLRGSLATIAPSCPNMRIKDSVYRVGSDFGCSTRRNLAAMINPWDYLVPPGERSTAPAARMNHGNMDYNDGKVAKIFIPRPYRTNADYN